MKTKEERFKELINDLFIGDYSVEITLDGQFKEIKYIDSEGDWLIDHVEKIKVVAIFYDKIWSVFEKEYGMNYNEVELLMNNLALKYFKIGDVSSTWHYSLRFPQLFNLSEQN